MALTWPVALAVASPVVPAVVSVVVAIASPV
jgi:hypothetical protein